MNSTDVVRGALSEDRLDGIESDFKAFMNELYSGKRQPYQWQLRLLRTVAATGEWPEALDAPTGAGKTTVIEIHIFLNGLAGWSEISHMLPRRLILTVNRRALVDGQYEHAKECIERLRKVAKTNPSGMISKICDGLKVRSDEGISCKDAKLVDVISLRGGDQIDFARNDWRIYPTMPMVICATPDMFGSRLLFRGYGVSKYARPLEAGLFAYDSIAVIDEAHLNRQLEKTARRVVDIESMSEWPIGVRPLSVMTATATPVNRDELENRICVAYEDFAADSALADRMTNPKPFELIYIASDLDKRKEAQIAGDECSKLHENADGCIGCIMNTVADAAAVGAQLEKKYGENHVICITGRMRSTDRFRATERIESPDTWFIVGTQALEVGLDIDFGALVTQLASGSALAQRVGRVNRFAKRESGVVRVVVPGDLQKNSGPYQPAELEKAKEWLERIKKTHEEEGLTPWLLASKDGHPPDADQERTVYERLEWADVDYFGITSEDIAPETDVMGLHPSNLDLWIRDEFTDDAEVYIVVRRMPRRTAEGEKRREEYDVGATQRILELVPPLPAEKFPVSLSIARQIFCGKNRDDSSVGIKSQVFLLREDDIPRLWVLGDSTILPGDVFAVDDTANIFLRDVVDHRGADTKDDIYACIVDNPDLYPDGAPLLIDVKNHSSGETGFAADIAQLDSVVDALCLDEDENGLENEGLALRLFEKWVREGKQDRGLSEGVDSPSWERLKTIIEDNIVKDERSLSDGTFAGSLDRVLYGERPEDGYALVYTPAGNAGSEWFNGTTTVSPDLVKLEQHLESVAERARHLGVALCVPEQLIKRLEEAGGLHDEGKRDSRFQELLRLGDRKARGISDDLAKSRFVSRKRAFDFRKACGLRGWRHEQRSAAVAWEQLKGENDMRDLVTRLVGTSHGHGRAMFDDDAARLLPSDQEIDEDLRAAAEYLFDYGAWEQIVDRTNRRYGVWGMAYLEAILRASDMQVSSEGR